MKPKTWTFEFHWYGFREWYITRWIVEKDRIWIDLGCLLIIGRKEE